MSKAGFSENMMTSISGSSQARSATSGLWVERPMCPILPAARSSRTYSMKGPSMMAWNSSQAST